MSNVQGRARATYKDVRELVPSRVPTALVRWHVTGQSLMMLLQWAVGH